MHIVSRGNSSAIRYGSLYPLLKENLTLQSTACYVANIFHYITVNTYLYTHNEYDYDDDGKRKKKRYYIITIL